MTKREFLARLRKGLSGLPQSDIEERLTFYGEMIDDRMEEGFSEEEAVAQIGSVDEIVGEIVAETPIAKLVKARIKPKRALRAWEIALIVLGSPVWLPLLIAALAVLLALVATLWAAVVSLWAAEATLALSAICVAVWGALRMLRGELFAGIAMLGVGLVGAGLSVFLFQGCRWASIGALRLTRATGRKIKGAFARGEARS